MEHKNLIMVGKQDSADGSNLSDRDIEDINNALLCYSKKWNKEFTNLNNVSNSLVNTSHDLNVQTAEFNKFIGVMFNRLNEIIDMAKRR